MDRRLLFLINHEWTDPSLDWLMAAVSSIEAWLPLIVVGIIALVLFGGFRGRAFLACTAMVLLLNDGVMTQMLKDVVGRPRPYEVLAGVRIVDLQHTRPPALGLLLPAACEQAGFQHSAPRGRSYPSGHVANNFAVAVLLAAFYPPWGALYFVFALVVSYSRVYVGAHWPSDVIGSAAQGAAIALLVLAICEWGWRVWAVRSTMPVHRRHPSLLLQEM